MNKERERLARRAAAGDLFSARRLVALLEDEGAPPVTTPALAEERIRSALIEKIEEAIRSSHTPRRAFIRFMAEEHIARWAADLFERSGWQVRLAEDEGFDPEPDTESAIWHMTLSSPDSAA